MSPSMQALVASYGYVGSVSTIYRQTSPGWRLVIHFDDRLTIAPDGRRQLAVRVVAEIGAPDGHDSKALHLTLQKTALRQAAQDWVWLGLELDVMAPHGMTAETLRAQPRLLGRLRSLMEDVLAMLDALPDNAPAPPGPKLRIEARLLGDLLVCRNGFAAGKGADIDPQYRVACRSACAWVAYILLPEFAAMLRLDESASQTTALGSGRDANSGDARHRNNPVANHAQMSVRAPLKNVRGKAPKPSPERGHETRARVDASGPENKSMAQSQATRADDVSIRVAPAGTTATVEVTTMDGVVSSLRPSRRKANRLARARALLHT